MVGEVGEARLALSGPSAPCRTLVLRYGHAFGLAGEGAAGAGPALDLGCGEEGVGRETGELGWLGEEVRMRVWRNGGRVPVHVGLEAHGVWVHAGR